MFSPHCYLVSHISHRLFIGAIQEALLWGHDQDQENIDETKRTWIVADSYESVKCRD